MRLNKYIADSGYASRRKADALIQAGHVRLNNETVTKPFIDVSSRDKVEVKGEAISPCRHSYIIFHKPKGVTVTVKDRFADKRIIDFIPAKFGRLYPVGRLDRDSTGLIILTNDGDFCHKVTHPKFEVEKEYLIKVSGTVKGKDALRAKKGLRDENEFLKVEDIHLIRKGENNSMVKVVIREGKKRHLRRLFKALGFTVLTLKRVRIGKLVLGDLKEGEYKVIGPNRIYSLLLGE